MNKMLLFVSIALATQVSCLEHMTLRVGSTGDCSTADLMFVDPTTREVSLVAEDVHEGDCLRVHSGFQHYVECEIGSSGFATYNPGSTCDGPMLVSQ